MQFTVEEYLMTFYEIFGLPSVVLDESNDIIFSTSELEENIIKYEESYKEYADFVRTERDCFITITRPQLARMWLKIPENNYVIVLGYAFLGQKNKIVIEKEIMKKTYSEEDYKKGIQYVMSACQMFQQEFVDMAKFIYQLIYKKSLDTAEKFIYVDEEKTPSISLDTIEFFETADKYEEFYFEKNVLEYVKLGRYNELEQFLHFNKIWSEAENNHETFISQKNFYRSLCVLSSKEAIDANVPYAQAHSARENYLSKVHELSTTKQLNDLMRKMLLFFAYQVSKTMETEDYSFLTSRAIEYIQENIYSKITLEVIAQHCSVSSDHLGRTFKKDTGVGINEFTNRLKINEALFLLEHSNLTIVEVSNLLAFSSQSYFTVVFKEIMKNTPKDYLNSLNKI